MMHATNMYPTDVEAVLVQWCRTVRRQDPRTWGLVCKAERHARGHRKVAKAVRRVARRVRAFAAEHERTSRFLDALEGFGGAWYT